MKMTPDKQIAVLLLSVEQELAAEVLRNLGEDHLDSLMRAMKELQELSIDSETVWSCYDELAVRMRQAGCRRLYFGVETASQASLDTLKKDCKACLVR